MVQSFILLSALVAALITSSSQATAEYSKRRWVVRKHIRVCPDANSSDCRKLKIGTSFEVITPSADGKFYSVRTADGHIGFVDGLTLSYTSAKEPKRQQTCKNGDGVSIGMTRQQIFTSCWGKPERINSTITASGRLDQLVYPGFNYLYLTDGILTSVQVSQ